MKIFYLFFVCMLAVCSAAYSQNIDILRKSDTFGRKEKHREFIYWNNPADTAGLEYIATLSSKASAMGGKGLWELWVFGWNRSNRLGGNVFIFRSYNESDSIKAELIFDLYLASEEALKRNAELDGKNVVYLFGNKGKAMPVQVNGESVDIPADSVLRYETPVGSELKLNKGGATGASWKIKGEEAKPALYLSVSGFGLGGAIPAGTVGLSFSSGRITEMNPNFARLMLAIQKK